GDAKRHLVNRIVRVSQAVPFGALGLCAPSEIGGACAHGDRTALFYAGDQFPPLPTVPLALGPESSRLPVAAVHAHLDVRDRSCTGPRDAADGQVAATDLVVRRRLSDQRSHLLQGDRLADEPAVALPFVPIRLDLIVPSERPVEQLDLG